MEDGYENFLKQMKANKPCVEDKEALKDGVIKRLRDKKEQNFMMPLMRVAAGLLIFINVGYFAWLEVSTHQSRLAMQTKVASTKPFVAEFQCRESIQTLIAAFNNSMSVEAVSPNKLSLQKKLIDDLLVSDIKLYEQIEKILLHMKLAYPQLWEAYNAGEVVKLSAWQMRREYKVCEWINH